jgi:DNA end-binding protein Ku
MPASLWSGNLRLSLVIIPVKLHSAITTEEAIAFRQIHAPSGTPISNLKGIITEQGFEEVDEGDIVKGYEHAKGQHVLIRPEEIEELKLEAKHTIDMARFVNEAEIDSRYWEKPYYLLPDGETADEGYVVIREALKQTGRVAVGQIIMGGRQHIVGIKAHGKGLLLSILRYANEVRDAGPYFDANYAAVDEEAVALAKQLVKAQSGKFEPEKMPDEYAVAVKELVAAKIEQRAPEVTVGKRDEPAPKVINIMAALKQSVEAKGRTKVRDAVRKRAGKGSPKEAGPRTTARPRPGPRRAAH